MLETFAGVEKDLEFHTGEKVTGAAQNPPFLIIVSQKADQTLWGIAVHEPPDLIELADQTLSPVPPEQRAFGTLQGISCVGMFNLEGNRQYSYSSSTCLPFWRNRLILRLLANLCL